MRLRVGQRVRLLHESGEGVITELIDRTHVEVTLDDDFPMDVHVDDIITIEDENNSFYGTQQQPSSSVRSMGDIFEISLAVVKTDPDTDFYIINPEPIDILYTCYVKIKRKYQGIAGGAIQSDEALKVFSTTLSEAREIRAIYVQLLPFKIGQGHPHAVDSYEIPWNKSVFINPTRYIDPLNKSGWIFSLRQKPTELEERVVQSPLKIKSSDLPSRREKVVDLHIEELVSKPHELSSAEMLKTQLIHTETMLSKAIMEDCAAITFIHGVGEGKLKKEVKKILMENEAVKAIYPGDPKKYGNGATKAELV